MTLGELKSHIAMLTANGVDDDMPIKAVDENHRCQDAHIMLIQSHVDDKGKIVTGEDNALIVFNVKL